MKYLFAAIFTLAVITATKAQPVYNGSMEKLNPDKTKAIGWSTSFQPEQLKDYPVTVDSLIKQDGKYSLCITKAGAAGEFGVIDFPIPYAFKGKEVELRGYLKTENVNSGYAGLWMRIDGTQAFDNMEKRGVKGTTEWQEYRIKLHYDDAQAINIHIGALLAGNGKLWADNFRLYMDGKPIEKVKPIVLETVKSNIDTIVITKQQVINLTALGQLWGFLKYHHPAVAQGNYNWDAELFKIMPRVLKAGNNQELSTTLEKWVDSYGVPPACKKCAFLVKDSEIKLKPDYGLLFTGQVFSPALTQKLTYILNNGDIKDNFYIKISEEVGNPSFSHENAYVEMTYPNAGYRMLTLFRYWNMIQYFYPDKHLIEENWDDVLSDCIPKFAAIANAQEYSLQTLALIARIHDTHANIWSQNRALTDFKGRFAVPFQANFIENKLVVTGYYNDTLNIKSLVKPGDVMEQINGKPVSQLIKEYLPYSAASNYATQLRDMPRNFLLRGRNATFELRMIRDGKPQQITVTALPFAKVNRSLDYNPDPQAPAYKLLDESIGYVFPGRYKNTDLPEIEAMFKNTKGIIIDMRCYPSAFMPFTFVPYIKPAKSNFVKFTNTSVSHPGLFTYTEALATPGRNVYHGKVVVIVNSTTQSQAEYTTMAFQSSPNVMVIGSATAGADGNVSTIVLPGNISTLISGIGILYPDGTETQRKGVKIDEVLEPTIKGVAAGKDELLDRAKEIIRKS